MFDPILVSLGLFVGTLVGLTGVGGGALLTPLLILVVGIRPTIAVGTDLAFAAITKAVGAYQHTRYGTSDHRLVARLALGSVPAALLSSWFMSVLESMDAAQTDTLLTRMLGIALLVAAGASLWRATRGQSWDKNPGPNPGTLCTALFGVLIGTMVGLTSIGAGSLLMAVFALFYRALPTSRAIGVDVMHGAVLATVAAMAHGMAGHIEMAMVTNLLLGSLPGVVLGSWLCTRLPSRPLRVGIAAMLAIAGVRLL
jgi:uncharacterized membrane protein YfcA